MPVARRSDPAASKMAMMFSPGDKVQRRDLPRGKQPAYRFKGTICGWYTNPVTKEPGWVVSLDHDPGCCQLFPEYMLERREE